MVARLIWFLLTRLIVLFCRLHLLVMKCVNRHSLACLTAAVRLSTFQVACRDWVAARRTCDEALREAESLAVPVETTVRLFLNRARASTTNVEASRLLKQAYEHAGGRTEAKVRALRIETGLEWATSLHRDGRLFEAEAVYRQSLEDARTTLACRQLLASALVVSSGVTALHLGKFRQSECCFRELIEPSAPSSDPADPANEMVGPVMVASAIIDMGVLDLERGHLERALQWFRKGLKTARTCHHLGPALEVSALAGMTLAHLRLGAIDEAAQCDQRANALRLPDDPRFARQLETIRVLQRARLWRAQGRSAEAAGLLRERLEIGSLDCLQRLETQIAYGTALREAGQGEDAETAFREALGGYEKIEPTDIPSHAEALGHYADALTAWGRTAEAEAVRERVADMRRKIAARDLEPDLQLRWPMPAASPLVGLARRRLAFVALLTATLASLYWWDVAEEGHIYWTPGMPGVVAAAIAALFCAYFLLQLKRFSLRTVLVAILLVATAGTVGHWRSLDAVQEVRFWAAVSPAQTDEVQRLIDDGLVKTLAMRGDLPATPVVMSIGYPTGHRARGELVLFLRPYREPRVRGLDIAFNAFVQDVALLASWPTDDPDRKVHATEAALTWYQAVRERFGEDAARAVAHASARIVKDTDVKEVFEHIERTEYQLWTHIRPP